MESMDAELLGGFDVGRAIVEEKCVSRLDAHLVEHTLEDGMRRLVVLHLIAAESVVEIVVDGVSVTAEIRAVGPVHHEGVGVAQEYHLIVFFQVYCSY